MDERAVSMTVNSLNRVEIDLSALRANYRTLQQRVGPDVKIMAIVKSQAYGHGMVPVAAALAAEGCAAFGVAEIWEGIELRQAGISGQIIVLLGAAAAGAEEMIRHRLEPVVFDFETILRLSVQAVKLDSSIGIHLKIDVGMGRIGIMPEEVADYAEKIGIAPGVSLEGILSHFPTADDPVSGLAAGQCRVFQDAVAAVKSRLNGEKVSHIANSAALIRFPESHFDMVRPGISLYGCYPAHDIDFIEAVDLRPVMSFKTSVIQVKDVPAGYGISYGHTFVTSRPTRLAVLPVGYNNGYLRKLSNRAEVLIRGKRAPIIGRVCMNVCMTNATDIPGVEQGDEVVLLGRQDEGLITAREIADWMETIHYEVLCLFGNLNRREYLSQDGKDQGK